MTVPALFEPENSLFAVNLATVNYQDPPFKFVKKGSSSYGLYNLQLNDNPCPCFSFGYISGADLGKGRECGSIFHVIRDIRLQIPPVHLQRLSSVLHHLLTNSKITVQSGWSLPVHEGDLSFGTLIHKKPGE